MAGYQGIGEWRSRAAAARGHDNPFVAMDHAARMLAGYGETEAAGLVQQAHAAGGEGDYGKCGELLRAAARACSARCAPEAQGLRNLADRVPDSEPEPAGRPSRRRDEDTGAMDGLGD